MIVFKNGVNLECVNELDAENDDAGEDDAHNLISIGRGNDILWFAWDCLNLLCLLPSISIFLFSSDKMQSDGQYQVHQFHLWNSPQ